MTQEHPMTEAIPLASEQITQACKAAIAKAEADGAPQEDIVIFHLAYNYLSAALSSSPAPSGQGVSGEVRGWIVGNNIGQWRTFDSFGWAWTDRRDLAVRYARREDAELVHGEDEDSWRVEEYPTSLAAPAPSCAPGEVERLREALKACDRRLWEDGYTVVDPVVKIIAAALSQQGLDAKEGGE